jgi:hypothetical protein
LASTKDKGVKVKGKTRKEEIHKAKQALKIER